MRWIDMHCDTLSEVRRQKKTLQENDLCVDVQRLLKAGSCAQFFACFINAAEYGLGIRDKSGNDVWDRAYTEALAMLQQAENEQNERFRIIRRAQEAADGLHRKKNDKLAAILTVEEGGVLNGRMERLDKLYEKGVRLITLTWNYENCIGSPNSRDGIAMKKGLTGFGKELVEQMNEKGMMIDVSHLSDGGFWDCIRRSRVPVVASHSNARSLCRHPRNLSDEMLYALGEKGGVAGVNFYGPFLREKGKAGVEDIVRHIRWMMNCAGEDAVGLGTDFDGFQVRDCPREIEGVSDMGKIWDALRKEGLTWTQIEKIAFGNVQRTMEHIWTEPGKRES